MGGLGIWPYGVQAIFYFIPPYGVNGRCMIFGPMVYRAFFYFCIPPYGVYGRCIIFGPMVYRAFLFFLNCRFMFFGPMVRPYGVQV